VYALAGDAATYCYVVTNSGDVTVTNIAVTDNSGSFSVGSLMAGQSAAVSSTFTVISSEDSAAVASGIVAATGQPVSSAPDDAAVVRISPSLSLQKTVNYTADCPGSESVSVAAGTTVTVCYVVTNTGDTTVENITINDNAHTYVVGTLAAGTSMSVSATETAIVSESSAAIANGNEPLTDSTVSSAPDSANVEILRPATPILVSTTPRSPSQNTLPLIIGTASPGMLVQLYIDSACIVPAGSVIIRVDATGMFAESVRVSANSTTTFFATATDIGGNVSLCSQGLTYVADNRIDAPTLNSILVSPIFPSTLIITGTAEAGATVQIYRFDATCSGPFEAIGPVSGSGSFTINSPNPNSVATYYAKAIDLAGNVSACSSGLPFAP